MTTVYVKRIDGIIGYVDYVNQPDMDLEEADDQDSDVVQFLNPVPSFYRISKMTPWLRMNDAEAVAMRQVMDAAPIRLQEIYKAAPYLQSNDDLWPTLYQMIAMTLSPNRADELLAPETTPE